MFCKNNLTLFDLGSNKLFVIWDHVLRNNRLNEFLIFWSNNIFKNWRNVGVYACLNLILKTIYRYLKFSFAKSLIEFQVLFALLATHKNACYV